ncbi:MAG: hypothetical protein OXT09_12035 [Myxococcales bacterium]|nr:hypothetical protein [Myxococcales bacterium]
MARKDPNMPTGARRAQIAKRAQLLLGLIVGSALLYRLLAGWFQ